MAGGSAILTGLVLLAFALVVGALTESRIRSDFRQQMEFAANDLASKIVYSAGPTLSCGIDLDLYAASEHAVIRVVNAYGESICATHGAPNLGPPALGYTSVGDYRVETEPTSSTLLLGVPAYVQYARPASIVQASVAKVRLFLIFGVVAGLALALLAGLAVARRAMRPIAELTGAAGEIARTRDPSLRLPTPEADDEVAELAHTLEDMLRSLDEARTETEGALVRQRRFVADASHELRTPLTSVLANLELLADELDGESGEAARSALRSSQRMRRLVANLLLLARADVGRTPERQRADLGAVLVEAAAELGPTIAEHELTVDAQPAPVRGARDDLHRMVLNLLENAVRHTPPGTSVSASTRHRDGQVELVVQDDGPGVVPELRARLFDRFVSGAGDHGGGSGLGLAIVRAVAESGGGGVALDPGAEGARFVVTLPAYAEPEPPAGDGAAAEQAAGPPAAEPHTSTTTGSTIGRRRSRS